VLLPKQRSAFEKQHDAGTCCVSRVRAIDVNAEQARLPPGRFHRLRKLGEWPEEVAIGPWRRVGPAARAQREQAEQAGFPCVTPAPNEGVFTRRSGERQRRTAR